MAVIKRLWCRLGIPAGYLLFFGFELWLASRPLFREFHYDWALSQSLVFSLLAGGMAIGTGDDLAVLLRRLLLLLLLSLDAIVFAQVFYGFCRPWYGLYLYLMFVPFAAWCGLALGLLAATVGEKRWSRALLFLGAYLLILLYPLFQLATSASIFAYSIWFGFWPGSLYDEKFHLPPAFYWHRLVALGFAVNLLALTAWRCGAGQRRQRARNGLLLVSFTLLSATLFFQDELQFSTSPRTIEKELGGLAKGGALEIYYPKDEENSPRVQGAIQEAFFYDHWLRRRLALTPLKPIKIYLYRSREERGHLTGAYDTTLGNPLSRTLHIVPEEYPLPLLRHELVHVLAADRGPWPLRLPHDIALAEGLAEAVYPFRGPYSHHQLAAAILANHLRPLAPFFHGLGFYRESPLIAYPLAGSFVSHLIQRHGLERFFDLYRHGDYRRTYGQSFAALLAQWRESLTRLRLPPEDEIRLDYLWKKGSIFERRCPRCTADLMEQAAGRQRGKNFEAAAATFEQAVLLSGGDPSPYLGLLQLRLSQGQFAEAARLCLEAPETFPDKVQRALSRIRFAAAARPENRAAILTRWLSLLQGEEDVWTRVSLTASLRLLARGQIADFKALELASSAETRLGVLRRQLAEGVNDPALLLYLAQLLSRQQRYQEAAETLAATPLPPPDSPWYFASLELRGQALAATHRYPEGLALFQQTSLEILRRRGTGTEVLRQGEAAQIADWGNRFYFALHWDLPLDVGALDVLPKIPVEK